MNSLITSIVKSPKFEKKYNKYSNDLWKKIENISTHIDDRSVSRKSSISFDNIYRITSYKKDVAFVKLSLKTIVDYINGTDDIGGVSLSMKKGDAIRFLASKPRSMREMTPFREESMVAITINYINKPMVSLVIDIKPDAIRIEALRISDDDFSKKYLVLVVIILMVASLKNNTILYTQYNFASPSDTLFFSKIIRLLGKKKEIVEMRDGRFVRPIRYTPAFYFKGPKIHLPGGKKTLAEIKSSFDDLFNGWDDIVFKNLKKAMYKISSGIGPCAPYIYNYIWACEQVSYKRYAVYLFSPKRIELYASMHLTFTNHDNIDNLTVTSLDVRSTLLADFIENIFLTVGIDTLMNLSKLSKIPTIYVFDYRSMSSKNKKKWGSISSKRSYHHSPTKEEINEEKNDVRRMAKKYKVNEMPKEDKKFLIRFLRKGIDSIVIPEIDIDKYVKMVKNTTAGCFKGTSSFDFKKYKSDLDTVKKEESVDIFEKTLREKKLKYGSVEERKEIEEEEIEEIERKEIERMRALRLDHFQIYKSQ